MPQKPRQFQPKSRAATGKSEKKSSAAPARTKRASAHNPDKFSKKSGSPASYGKGRGDSFGASGRSGPRFRDRDEKPGRFDREDRPARSYHSNSRDGSDRDDRRDRGDRNNRSSRDGSARRPQNRSERPYGERSSAHKSGGKERFDKDSRAPRTQRSYGRKDDDRGHAENRGYGASRSTFRNDRDRKPFDRKERSYGDRAPTSRAGGRSYGDRASSSRTGRSYDDRAPSSRTRMAAAHVASDETRDRLKSPRQSYGAPSPHYLYGQHPVTEALLNKNRRSKRLFCTEGSRDSLEKILKRMDAAGLERPPLLVVGSEDIARLLPRDAVHQDMLLDADPLEEIFLVDILLHASEDACVVVLDQVTDPHNVGAILRSAAAFGASAVVVQKLHAPDITGTLAKSASGAVEHVPIVREVNLSRALTQLREAGFTCLGLDEKGKKTLAQAAPAGKTAIVLGAEGDGLRRLVAESCDALVRLPTGGAIASLNVSNAAAIALYEIKRAGEEKAEG